MILKESWPILFIAFPGNIGTGRARQSLRAVVADRNAFVGQWWQSARTGGRGTARPNRGCGIILENWCAARHGSEKAGTMQN